MNVYVNKIYDDMLLARLKFADIQQRFEMVFTVVATRTY